MPQGLADGEAYSARLTRVTLDWVLTALVLFPILAVLGFLMRALQAGYLACDAARMVLRGDDAARPRHGGPLVRRRHGGHQRPPRAVRAADGLAVSWIAFGATLTGVALLLAATLVGRLGVGWYFLYPLPFHSGGTWPAWATASLFAALAIMGVGWTLWAGDLLWAIARRYRLSDALGWQYLRGSGTPEVPPIIIIATVSFIGVLAGLVAAVVILALVAVEQLTSGFTNDALLIKNLTFYFGHMLVNITMYFGVAMVYEIMPAYTGRPWKSNTLVAASWNLVLLLVMFAYLHHLYMDFAQPQWLQVTGQLSSYLISVPAAVVTIFSTLALVYGCEHAMEAALADAVPRRDGVGDRRRRGGDRFDGDGEQPIPQHAVGAGAFPHLLRHGRRADDSRRGLSPVNRAVQDGGERAAHARDRRQRSASADTGSC